jgi:EAL domain-containing protein (putative c-di-GMP-specific phosphodiesterase class I)
MGAQAVRLSNVDIDNALNNKDFEVLFQPIFDLGNGALGRMESFVRWRHPELGVLPPGAFVSFFENQGRMSELTRYVLAAALTSYGSWRGPFAPGFSINLALSDISDDSFSTHFEKLLRDREFPPDLVTLECPMPPVDANFDQLNAHFARLRRIGARLAIEVRGQANEFLREIDPFPFDEIKTGGSSILRFARTVRGPGLSAISDLLDIAARVNAATTAVGVEDQASLSALRGLGFTAAQGNHLAKVGPLTDFRPGRVNEVRTLLGLPELTSEDLASLFRTSAPKPQALSTMPIIDVDAEVIIPLSPDSQRPAPADAATDLEMNDPAPSKKDAQRRARAREKAMALALAKRSEERDARKAAAIKRAKAKVIAQQTAQAAKPGDCSAASAAPNPRDLQQRLAHEFFDPPPLHAPPPLHKAEKAESAADGSDSPTAKPTPMEKIDAMRTMRKKHAATASTITAAEKTASARAPDPAPDRPEVEKSDRPETAPFDKIPAETGELDAYRLTVTDVRAYFEKCVRVGGPARNAQLRSTGMASAPSTSPPSMNADPAPTKPAAAAERPLDNAGEIAPADAVPEKAPAKSKIASLAASPVLRAADKNRVAYEKSEDVPARRPYKQRNFLTRKYQFRLPNHFWPKSWKRRYRRWRAGRAEIAAARGA